MEKPLVSICCLVYNHEPFLRECFEGFVMQRTTFPIEILVHDDASTDHSADIIREYTVKYPNIFKPIYQTENQYSKGVPILATYQFPRAQGKYIAMCEGDDYWTDPLKLQNQVDFMETHEEYMLCYHKVKLRVGGNLLNREVSSTASDSVFVKGDHIDTASVLFRTNQHLFDLFCELGRVGFGDYPLWFLCATQGEIKEINETMAVYRAGVGITAKRSQIRNYIEFCEMLCKLSMIVKRENTSLYLLLEDEIEKTKQKIENFNCEEKYNSVLNSHAFRLGNFLLQPIYWLKKIIKALGHLIKRYRGYVVSKD